VRFVLDVLDSHRENGTYRTLKTRPSLIDFSSNDYLGLANCPHIRNHLIKELESGCPLGATGSRLLSGHTDHHDRVENFLASKFGASSALLFGSGYMANIGVIGAFNDLPTHFFSDQANHASLIDGLRLTKSAKTVFRHNDLNHLEKLLVASSSSTKVIITESVFSMDGDLAPLEDLHQLAMRFDAWLVIDEAHATGVFGPQGLGRTEGWHGDWAKLISVHTGGKALGGQGAFVISDKAFRELLINRARTFIFSTALSPLHSLQIEYAIRDILVQPERGAVLLRRSEHWRKSLPSKIATLSCQSQIIPIVLGSNGRALKIADQLQQWGFDVRAIRSPTVPSGTERLRVTIKSFHSDETLQELAGSLKDILQ
jgi:8-amino-7-oxononanoate synthase